MSSISTQSVIVPCRGHHLFLNDCLSSLHGQWKSVNQVIIVIDDDKLSLKKAYDFVLSKGAGFTKYTLVETSQHSGVYASINVGLSFNRCDLVSFCGADDMWDSSRSAHMLRSASSWKSICNSYHCKIDAEGRRIRRSIEPLGGVYSYTRSMLDKLGMFRQWPTSADSDMFYRAKAAGGYLNLYRSYSYFYRQHGDQLTHRPSTAIGSDERAKYESMWHDGTSFHEEDLVGHKILVND